MLPRILMNRLAESGEGSMINSNTQEAQPQNQNSNTSSTIEIKDQ